MALIKTFNNEDERETQWTMDQCAYDILKERLRGAEDSLLLDEIQKRSGSRSL
jgi:hypothetical protein